MFDFSAYLASSDPGQEYTVKQLTGGFVNVTVRATRHTRGTTVSGTFQDRSLILKYAPPYIAGRGAAFPMSQFRQTLEAQALALASSAIPESGVLIPKVFKHDVESHVLVISDLGNMPSLSDIFSELGGYTEFGGRPEYCPPASMFSLESCSYFSEIGNKLGRFFALLHSSQTLKYVEGKIVVDPKEASDTKLTNVWLETATKPVRSQLSAFPTLLSRDEAESLYQDLERDFTRPLFSWEKSFVLGDCWTAAILLDPQDTKQSPKIGVIDWEFAGVGRGIHGDIAQLLAHLELFRIAAVHQKKDDQIKQIDLISSNLMKSYISWSSVHGAPWTHEKGARLMILRSAFLAQAAEMVNCAFWKVWECEDIACRPQDGSHIKNQHQCVLVQKMVQRAIWYFREAQEISLSSPHSYAYDRLAQSQINMNSWGLLSLVGNEKNNIFAD